MKKVIIICIAALAATMTLTGCSGASDKGTQAAKQLAAAWGDPAAIQKVASDYTASRDSLSFPGASGSMDGAFFDACTNDTMLVMAQAIALSNEELAKETASAVIGGLKDGSMDAGKASARLSMLSMALFTLDRNDDLATCFRIIDEAAQELSEDQQMLVYARSCAPNKLGDAFKQDRAQGDATEADRKAKIVEGILTGKDLDTFKSHYYAK